MGTIQIRGARTHNLKNIDLDLPRDKLIVISLCWYAREAIIEHSLYFDGAFIALQTFIYFYTLIDIGVLFNRIVHIYFSLCYDAVLRVIFVQINRWLMFGGVSQYVQKSCLLSWGE